MSVVIILIAFFIVVGTATAAYIYYKKKSSSINTPSSSPDLPDLCPVYISEYKSINKDFSNIGTNSNTNKDDITKFCDLGNELYKNGCVEKNIDGTSNTINKGYSLLPDLLDDGSDFRRVCCNSSTDRTQCNKVNCLFDGDNFLNMSSTISYSTEIVTNELTTQKVKDFCTIGTNLLNNKCSNVNPMNDEKFTNLCCNGSKTDTTQCNDKGLQCTFDRYNVERQSKLYQNIVNVDKIPNFKQNLDSYCSTGSYTVNNCNVINDGNPPIYPLLNSTFTNMCCNGSTTANDCSVSVGDCWYDKQVFSSMENNLPTANFDANQQQIKDYCDVGIQLQNSCGLHQNSPKFRELCCNNSTNDVDCKGSNCSIDSQNFLNYQITDYTKNISSSLSNYDTIKSYCELGYKITDEGCTATYPINNELYRNMCCNNTTDQSQCNLHSVDCLLKHNSFLQKSNYISNLNYFDQTQADDFCSAGMDLYSTCYVNDNDKNPLIGSNFSKFCCDKPNDISTCKSTSNNCASYEMKLQDIFKTYPELKNISSYSLKDATQSDFRILTSYMPISGAGGWQEYCDLLKVADSNQCTLSTLYREYCSLLPCSNDTNDIDNYFSTYFQYYQHKTPETPVDYTSGYKTMCELSDKLTNECPPLSATLNNDFYTSKCSLSDACYTGLNYFHDTYNSYLTITNPSNDQNIFMCNSINKAKEVCKNDNPSYTSQLNNLYNSLENGMCNSPAVQCNSPDYDLFQSSSKSIDMNRDNSVVFKVDDLVLSCSLGDKLKTNCPIITDTINNDSFYKARCSLSTGCYNAINAYNAAINSADLSRLVELNNACSKLNTAKSVCQDSNPWYVSQLNNTNLSTSGKCNDPKVICYSNDLDNYITSSTNAMKSPYTGLNTPYLPQCTLADKIKTNCPIITDTINHDAFYSSNCPLSQSCSTGLYNLDTAIKSDNGTTIQTQYICNSLNSAKNLCKNDNPSYTTQINNTSINTSGRCNDPNIMCYSDNLTNYKIISTSSPSYTEVNYNGSYETGCALAETLKNTCPIITPTINNDSFYQTKCPLDHTCTSAIQNYQSNLNSYNTTKNYFQSTFTDILSSTNNVCNSLNNAKSTCTNSNPSYVTQLNNVNLNTSGKCNDPNVVCYSQDLVNYYNNAKQSTTTHFIDYDSSYNLACTSADKAKTCSAITDTINNDTFYKSKCPLTNTCWNALSSYETSINNYNSNQNPTIDLTASICNKLKTTNTICTDSNPTYVNQLNNTNLATSGKCNDPNVICYGNQNLINYNNYSKQVTTSSNIIDFDSSYTTICGWGSSAKSDCPAITDTINNDTFYKNKCPLTKTCYNALYTLNNDNKIYKSSPTSQNLQYVCSDLKNAKTICTDSNPMYITQLNNLSVNSLCS